jgi:hypothetical protein
MAATPIAATVAAHQPGGPDHEDIQLHPHKLKRRRARGASDDVSELVSGVTQPWTSFLPGSVPVPCGSACKPVVTSSTGLDSSDTLAPGPYTANAWPPVFGAALQGIGAVDSASQPGAAATATG